MNEGVYHPLYLRGIEDFNRGRFFRSHELWERLWLDEPGASKEFYKGLIQAAVCLHHLSRGNRHGARKLLDGARHYLGPYRPTHLGIDLVSFLDELEGCCRAALDREERPGRARTSTPAPTIRLRDRRHCADGVSYP
jgi:hypothetical protein